MEKELITAGITCDNYKVSRFEKQLKKKGFTDYEIKNFTDDGLNKIIKVKVLPDQVKDIQKICKEVELYFKRYN